MLRTGQARAVVAKANIRIEEDTIAACASTGSHRRTSLPGMLGTRVTGRDDAEMSNFRCLVRFVPGSGQVRSRMSAVPAPAASLDPPRCAHGRVESLTG